MDAPALHIISLFHTQTTYDYSWCAFTSLAMSQATMMTRLGREVYLYSGPANDAECTEHIPCSIPPLAGIKPTVPAWTEAEFAPMNRRVIDALSTRLKPQDILLMTTSYPQQQITKAYPANIAVEYCVGYYGHCQPFRVFPSYAWMHLCYGGHRAAENGNPHTAQGKFYDAMIPHELEVEKFHKGKGDGGYLAFLGRLGVGKGEDIAVQISKNTGIPLKLAGPGNPPDYGEYLGVLKPAERSEFLGGAIATLALSTFIEPFNLVAIESQLVGTPAITPDFGAFTETVEDEVTGYRCHTMAEFELAAQYAGMLDRDYIRQRALDTYSFDAIAPQFDRYYNRLGGLWGDGFYETIDDYELRVK